MHLVQQGAELACAQAVFDDMHLAGEPRVIGIAAVGIEVRPDPLPQALGLADIQRLTSGPKECVDAWRFGQGIE